MLQKTVIHSRKNNVLCFTSAKPLNFKEKYFKNNTEKICSYLKIKPIKIVYAKQIHSKKAVIVRSPKVKVLQKADGFITGLKNILLVIFTADCLPVFIYDKQNKSIGIAHSGWRGTYKEIIKNVVKKMKKCYNVKNKDLKFIFGPYIKKCCYEVGEDLAGKFENKFGRSGVIKRKGRFYLDLAEINKKQILKLGIPEKNISSKKVFCTSCKNRLFYSYRRDGKGTGRMMNGIIVTSDKIQETS